MKSKLSIVETHVPSKLQADMLTPRSSSIVFFRPKAQQKHTFGSDPCIENFTEGNNRSLNFIDFPEI